MFGTIVLSVWYDCTSGLVRLYSGFGTIFVAGCLMFWSKELRVCYDGVCGFERLNGF